MRRLNVINVAVAILIGGIFALIDESPNLVQASESLADPIGRGLISVKLTTVSTGLTAPNWGAFAPGDNGRLFVTDQDGILWAIDLAAGAKSVFLDVRDRIVALGVAGPGTFDERGLLASRSTLTTLPMAFSIPTLRSR